MKLGLMHSGARPALELREVVVAHDRTRLRGHDVAVHRRRRKRILVGAAVALRSAGTF